jgi:hypothetical protein
MILKRLIGLSGSLFGLVFPAVMLLAAPPPLGWQGAGGFGMISVFLLDAGRPRYFGEPREDVISPKKVDCPGGEDGHRLALLDSPLPDAAPGQRPYAGLVACILVSPAGQPIRVELVDGAGKRVNRPAVAGAILARWRFEASPNGWRELAWQPVPLEGRMEFTPVASEIRFIL